MDIIDMMADTGFFILLVATIAVAVLGVVGLWRLLAKADKPGWGALIPFYNIWAWGRMAFAQREKATIWTVSFAVMFLSLASKLNTAWTFDASSGLAGGLDVMSELVIMTLVFAIAALLEFAMRVQACISMARAFGKGGGWATGLFFLCPFFLFALGNADVKYLGPDKFSLQRDNPKNVN